MRIFKKILKDRRRAVSPILATVIIFGLIIVGIAITFIQVLPEIDRLQSNSAISTVKVGFLRLDKAVTEIIPEASFGTETYRGTRTVNLALPRGSVTLEDGIFFSFGVQDESDISLATVSSMEKLGELDYSLSSAYDILPLGSTQYLKGPFPSTQRDQVIVVPYGDSNYVDPANLTLSHRVQDEKHHVSLNYRVKVFISIKTDPSPTIEAQIFIIALSGNFDTIKESFRELKVSARITNHSTITIPEPTETRTEVKFVWWTPGTMPQTVWSSTTIQGLQEDIYQIRVIKTIYTITIG